MASPGSKDSALSAEMVAFVDHLAELLAAEFAAAMKEGADSSAIYARFSSENERAQSIDDQIRVCRELAAHDGITVLEGHIYFDEAQSGAIRARPGLEALKKAAEDKQFDALLVDDSSRLSRDNQHFITLLCLPVSEGSDSSR